MPVLDLNKNKIERTFPEKVKFYLRQGVDWTREKVQSTAKFVKENPQEAAAILGVGVTIISGTTKLVKSVNRHRAIKQEQWHRDREVYDHSSNMYLTTRRKLTKDDIDRINQLKREKGYKTSEALSELNLLKR